MKKDMPLEGLRWSRDSGSALYDTPQNGRSRTGWGGIATTVRSSFRLKSVSNPMKAVKVPFILRNPMNNDSPSFTVCCRSRGLRRRRILVRCISVRSIPRR